MMTARLIAMAASLLLCVSDCCAGDCPVPGQVDGLSMRLPWTTGDAFVVGSSYCASHHSGYQVDFPMREGTPVLAVAPGTVIQVGDYASKDCDGDDVQKGGIFVKLQHTAVDGTLYNSSYLHLSQRVVDCGDEVSQGQLLGYSGETGCATGPHLHFHIRRANQSTCPIPSELENVRPVPMVGQMVGSQLAVITEFVEGQSYRAIDLPPTSDGSPTWTTRTPPARSSLAMVYDSARGRIVLFGGVNASGLSRFGDTWEWNGSTWTARATTGPEPRTGHAMAYDSVRGRTVLFGGSGTGGRLGDTWEWDGSTWTLRATTGPLPREHHAMAYDAARGRVVLFGGIDSSFENYHRFDDTWEWDGNSWIQQQTPGPSVRAFHAMAYDAARGRIVLFGGYDRVDYLDDTWEWDGTSWTQRIATPPNSRAYHAMAYDTARGRVILFGGYNTVSGALSETWEWDGASWTQRSTTGPGRTFHAMAYDTARARAIVFGGTHFDDTWEWDGTSWTQHSAMGPGPRELHAIAYDTNRHRAVIFGGSFPLPLGDTWEWNGTTWAERAVTGPPPRHIHAMAYDSVRERTVLFGGRGFGGWLGDTWEWDGSTWIQRASTGPGPREGHAMAYDAARGRVVLFGGRYGSLRGDTWEWDGAVWNQKATTGPSPRELHAMAYDTARGRTVLFGGVDGSNYLGDTWEWNGASWALRPTVTGPSPRAGHAMAYDSVRGRTVLFGGPPYATDVRDTWEWSGASWLRRATGGAPPRQYHAMAYDTARGRIILFGGSHNSIPLGDTWELPSSDVYVEPADHDHPVPPPYCPVSPPVAGQDKLIVVVHGWRTDASTYAGFWLPLRDAIAARVGPDWKVESYDWVSDSQTPEILGPLGSDVALIRAVWQGYRLGRKIAQQVPSYSHVHLIAHSAGCALIAAATYEIKRIAPEITVHTTYLDAFAGTFIIAGVRDYKESYGGPSDWSDFYRSLESLDIACLLLRPDDRPTGDWTSLNLPRTYRVDISFVDPDFDPDCLSTHSWPRCFYGYTVADSPINECATPEGENCCLAPEGSTLGYGFSLSYEQWSGLQGYSGWIASRLQSYPKGGTKTLSPNFRGIEPESSVVFRTRRDAPLDLAQTLTVVSSSLAVQTAGNLLTMTTQPPGAEQPSPAWVNFQITTTKPINFVAYDVAFTNKPAAAGLVTLYVNEEERGKVDEPYALPGSQSFAMPTPGELAPGPHVVSFRLDPFNALASNISIQNLATGWGGFVPFGDANIDGTVNFDDVTSALANWGSSATGASGLGDSNADGIVGIGDITSVLANWGNTYP